MGRKRDMYIGKVLHFVVALIAVFVVVVFLTIA